VNLKATPETESLPFIYRTRTFGTGASVTRSFGAEVIQRVSLSHVYSVVRPSFTDDFPNRVDEYETLLTDNRIWKQRTVGIGVVSPERALALGFTGPMLRG